MYSDELKLKLVKEYFEGGLGIKALAQKYCMDRSSLR
ncbi:transposase, partial [Lachnoclostridium pacaense]|nr:transposase [Lachnoclostridium pacaense]